MPAKKKVKEPTKKWWVISEDNDRGPIYQESFDNKERAEEYILDTEKSGNSYVVGVYYGVKYQHNINVALLAE